MNKKLVIGLVIGMLSLAIAFCIAVCVGCAINGLTFSEQIISWFSFSSEVAEETLEVVKHLGA